MSSFFSQIDLIASARPERVVKFFLYSWLTPCHLSVSHTTDDLVFEWEEDVPLDVWKNIELPQLQLEGNYTNDCTQVYATGNTDMLTQQKSQTQHSFLFRQLYMPRSSFRLEAPPRILHVSYLHTNMFNRRYVCKLKRDYLMFSLLTLINYCTFLVGILLDKT